MKKILKSFTDKKFKYGAFSSVMTLAVIAVLVAINLVAGQLNISFDMTAEKIYSISGKTKEILGGLTEDITIYTLYKTGSETSGDNYMNSQILQQYADASSRVKIVNRDPYLYPQFVESFAKDSQQIPVNSLIVVSGARSRIVPAGDLVSTEFNYNTFSSQVVSYDIEPQVTNAINYVTTERISNIYCLEGHGETALPESLTKQITLAGYEVKTVDLTKADMPEDCDVFIATHPQADWSDNEAGKIAAYLQNNGKALFIIGYSSSDLANVRKTLNPYGVSPGQYLIVEGNPNNYTQGSPLAILADYTGAEAVSALAAGPNRMIMYAATAVDSTSEPVGSTVKIEPLAVTSGQSYAKVSAGAQTIAKEPGDASGPFNMAVAITDKYFSGATDYTTKLIFTSCYTILNEEINSSCRNANWDFVVASVNWLQGQTSDSAVYIQPKSATTSVGVLSKMTQANANAVAGVCAIGVPVAVIVVGLIWWLRRRYS